WSRLIGIASPSRTETAGECLGALIPRSGKCNDLSLLEARDLRNDVGSGAKPVNPQALGIAGLSKRAISNQSSTEERSRGDIVERVRKSIAIVSMNEGEFGVSSIQRVACKVSLFTKIFSMRSAILAFATRPS